MRISLLPLAHGRGDRSSRLAVPEHPVRSVDVLVVRDDVTRDQMAEGAQNRLCERNGALDRGRCVKDVENACVITLGKPSHQHTIRRMSYGLKACTTKSFTPCRVLVVSFGETAGDERRVLVCLARWSSSPDSSSCSARVASTPPEARRSTRPGSSPWPHN